MYKMVCYKFIIAIFLLCSFVRADDSKEISEESSTEDGNYTQPQDLYVIKSVVYEIGILTDVGNDSDVNLNETREQVDVSFYNPEHNGSFIDLSKIPLPIQTNVSGVSVTGVVPTNLGSLLLPFNGTATEFTGTSPLLPNKQIKVTHNISTINPDKGTTILSNLPKILGLDKEPIKKTEDDKKN